MFLGTYTPLFAFHSVSARRWALRKSGRILHAGKVAADVRNQRLMTVWPKLQALVYDILPSTTAVFSYAIRVQKTVSSGAVFCWCSNSSKFVTYNSNKTRRVIYSRQQSLHQHE